MSAPVIRMISIFALLGVLPPNLAAQTPASQPKTVIAIGNADFEAGDDGMLPEAWGGGGEAYEFMLTRQSPHSGKQCATLAFTTGDKDGFGTIAQGIRPANLRGHRVRLSGWMRSKNVSGAAVFWMRVNGDAELPLAFGNMRDRPVKGTTDWKQYEITLDVSKDATGIVLGALLQGDGAIWMDDLKMEIVDGTASAPAASGTVPGVFEMRGEYTLHANSGLADLLTSATKGCKIMLLMPLPLNYREQVPLSYELTADPPEAIHAARIYEDKPGNWVAEVKAVVPAGRSSAELKWRALVLCGPRSFENVPKSAPLPKDEMKPASWPAEARPWLQSTLAVQCDDERIVAAAKKIRGDSRDCLVIIAETIKQTRDIYAKQSGMCETLDAVGALTKKGSCTSCANLVAALLRANGIPARILAGYPLWSGPLQTHYIVEAFVPDYGWYPIESTLLRAPWPPTAQMQVCIVPPEYEDKSAARIPNAGGVPYLTLTERPNAKKDTALAAGSVNAKRYCDHIATLKLPLEGYCELHWNPALETARKRWAAWLKTGPSSKDGPLASPVTNKQIDDCKDWDAVMKVLN